MHIAITTILEMLDTYIFSNPNEKPLSKVRGIQRRRGEGGKVNKDLKIQLRVQVSASVY